MFKGNSQDVNLRCVHVCICHSSKYLRFMFMLLSPGSFRYFSPLQGKQTQWADSSWDTFFLRFGANWLIEVQFNRWVVINVSPHPESHWEAERSTVKSHSGSVSQLENHLTNPNANKICNWEKFIINKLEESQVHVKICYVSLFCTINVNVFWSSIKTTKQDTQQKLFI